MAVRKKIPVYDSHFDIDNYCQDCFKKSHGKSKVCLTCFKTFYFIEDWKEIIPEDCYECDLKKNGLKKKCLNCKGVIYIKKEDKAWKKRCYDCWLEPRRKIK